MALKLITAATVEPVTLAQAKAQLNVDHDDDNDLIELLISVTREHLDGEAGLLQRALVTQTWDLYLDAFPCGDIRIPLPPLQSVTSVKYDDENGDEQTVDAENYSVDTVNEPGWLRRNHSWSWPTTYCAANAVRVRFIAGYPPSTDSPPDLLANFPKPLMQWMLLQIGTFYRQRETLVIGSSVAHLPWLAESLIQRYRVYV